MCIGIATVLGLHMRKVSLNQHRNIEREIIWCDVGDSSSERSLIVAVENALIEGFDGIKSVLVSHEVVESEDRYIIEIKVQDGYSLVSHQIDSIREFAIHTFGVDTMDVEIKVIPSGKELRARASWRGPSHFPVANLLRV